MIRAEDPQTIVIKYPRQYDESSILPEIRLEIGALAAWTPARDGVVTPYVAEHMPDLFEQKSTIIRTVLPERTFWEKATILHHEANRPESSKIPARYARHYYDIYCIGHSQYKDAAFNQLELLKKVVDFKKKFYPRGWACYDDAKPGSLKLVPPAYRLEVLSKDYADMQQMFFANAPEFDEMMKYIQALEIDINML